MLIFQIFLLRATVHFLGYPRPIFLLPSFKAKLQHLRELWVRLRLRVSKDTPLFTLSLAKILSLLHGFKQQALNAIQMQYF
ncbi:hypothetical protein CW304_29735 [Bacillus sp. UFRGS-B20]|nr:hypothetical protein CW304_29735 [Bacillus sp. UFRGS-B20]